MSEEAFQEVLARAVTDDAFRRAACDGPPPVWEALGVSRADGERLRGIPRDRLALFARAILTNRYGRIVESLPKTCLLLGARAVAIFDEFCRSYPPENKIHREGLAFAGFLDGQFQVAPPEPWYLQDVLSYEAHLLDLRFHFDGDYSGGAVVAPPEDLLQQPDRLQRIVPRRLRHHRLLELGCDIEALVEGLENGTPPAEVERAECFLLAHVEPSGVCGQLVLSPPLVALYLLVDGETTAADFPGRLAMSLAAPELAGQGEFRHSCLSALAELASRRIVALELV